MKSYKLVATAKHTIERTPNELQGNMKTKADIRRIVTLSVVVVLKLV